MMTLILMVALQSEGSSTMVTVRNADTYRLPADLGSDAGEVALTHVKSTAEVFHKFDPKNFGVFRVDEPDHFLFKGLGFEKGALFGRAPAGIPIVGGHEADVRLSTLRAMTGPAPAGATVPEEPAGMATLARVVRSGYRLIDYFCRWTQREEAVLAEMLYWERPRGGRVFHAGAIGAGWALSGDPAFQGVLKNVLKHFGIG